MSLFVNHTVRSAEVLLADLSACRQMRHLGDGQRQAAIDHEAERQNRSRSEWLCKHPDPGNPCVSCGKPRSKISCGVPGLCWSCYVGKVVDFWQEDVFATAIKLHGLSCDACDDVFAVDEGEYRAAAIRCLDNIEGEVKPILCKACGQDLKAFCSRNFGRGWRAAPDRDIEKMAIAWFAQKIKVLAEQVKRVA